MPGASGSYYHCCFDFAVVCEGGAERRVFRFTVCRFPATLGTLRATELPEAGCQLKNR